MNVFVKIIRNGHIAPGNRFALSRLCSLDQLVVGAIRLQDELPQAVLRSGISEGINAPPGGRASRVGPTATPAACSD